MSLPTISKPASADQLDWLRAIANMTDMGMFDILVLAARRGVIQPLETLEDLTYAEASVVLAWAKRNLAAGDTA